MVSVLTVAQALECIVLSGVRWIVKMSDDSLGESGQAW